MKRLVYSPKAYAYVKRSNDQIVNLSPYITAGRVERQIGMVSSAELTLRNPQKIFTKGVTSAEGPYFHPMDAITIWLERIRGYPVQVFSGYLDTTPYLQLYPGTVNLSASCTLKRLLHTYWDPALPFSRDFLAEYGWFPGGSGIINLSAESEGNKMLRDIRKEEEPESVLKKLDDGAIGALLFAVLKHIVEWDPKNIRIESLPTGIIEQVAAIFASYNSDAKAIRGQIEDFIKRYIGDGVYGGSGTSGSGNTSGGNTELVNGPRAEQVWWFFRDNGFTEEGAAGAMGSLSGESADFDPKVSEYSGGGGYGIAQWTSEPRKSNLLAKKNYDTLEVQLNYIMEELRGGYQDLLSYMKSTQDLDRACFRWTEEYERPAVNNHSYRVGNAKAFFNKFKGAEKDGSRKSVQPQTGTTASASSTDGTEERSASRGGGDKDESANKIFMPVDKQYINYDNWGEDRGDHLHDGEDFSAPGGANVYAVKDGKVVFAGDGGGYGNYIRIQHGDGYVTGYAHLQSIGVRNGQQVTGGKVIGKVNNTGHSFGNHLHFNVSKNFAGGSGYENNIAPEQYLKGAVGSSETGSGTAGGGGGGGGGASYQDMLSTAKATAFVQDLEWPGIADTMEAITLSGVKSLMNDKPVMPFIEQLSQASMRQFQSLPNGDFFAFYPDYFGQLGHRKPYWLIRDIEILDGGIQLSDEALATHVFGVGDTSMATPGIGQFERMMTTGVVNIFNVQQSGFTPQNPEEEGEEGARVEMVATDPQEAINFLKKYGARPHVEEAPFIRSPVFEAFMAHQTFNLMWSRLFLTSFMFTFMPELYPGGIVGLPDHGLQLYIDSVTHSFDYEAGFTTEAALSAPASLDPQKAGQDPLSFGLVRAATQS